VRTMNDQPHQRSNARRSGRAVARAIERREQMRRHRPTGGWSIKRLSVAIPYPAWEPRLCAADKRLWPEECPLMQRLRERDAELDHALASGYMPDELRE
jgi:hypothetical protein